MHTNTHVLYHLESVHPMVFLPSNCGQCRNSFIPDAIACARPDLKLIFGITLCERAHSWSIYVLCVCVFMCLQRIILLFVGHKFWLVIFVINQYYFHFSAQPNSIRVSTNTNSDRPVPNNRFPTIVGKTNIF